MATGTGAADYEIDMRGSVITETATRHGTTRILMDTVLDPGTAVDDGDNTSLTSKAHQGESGARKVLSILAKRKFLRYGLI